MINTMSAVLREGNELGNLTPHYFPLLSVNYFYIKQFKRDNIK